MQLTRRRMMAGTLAAAAAAVLAACGEPQLVDLPDEFQGGGDPGEAPPTAVIPEGTVQTGPRGPVSV
ncbi:MAG TPA: twin-arginine translocation signal domain-containing protein, partial [Chloroflexota bacterium]|nr:twin-arginine translocation signal domain-containing protein [Chloroflexota bacterium]